MSNHDIRVTAIPPMNLTVTTFDRDVMTDGRPCILALDPNEVGIYGAGDTHDEAFTRIELARAALRRFKARQEAPHVV